MLTRRDWRGEAVMALIAGILILLVGFGVVFEVITSAMGIAGQEKSTFWRLLAGLLALQVPTLALTHGFLRVHQTGWLKGFGLAWNSMAWKWGLSIAVGAVLVGYPIEYGVFELMRVFGHKPESQLAVRFLTEAPGWQRVIIGFLAVVPAAIAEESLFRGVLYSAGRDFGYPKVAIAGTALIFGLAHAHVAAFIPLTLLGAGLAWGYERTGNLVTCYIAHAAYNAIGLAVAVSGIGGE